MKKCLTGLLVIGVWAFLGATDTSWAEHFAPHDWGGSSLTLHDGDVIWGVHRNMGTLTIPAGAEVTVFPYDESIPESGFLELDAETIIIDGKISARGAGYPGGAGGGGGGGAAMSRGDEHGGEGGQGGHGDSSTQAGAEGTPGHSGEDEPGGNGGIGGQGTGPFAGAGGTGGQGKSDHSGRPGESGLDGGYDSTEGNTDLTTDTSTRMGSGGGGGGGGAGGGTKEGKWYEWEPVWYGAGGGGGGGASGGRGGGYIKLTVSDLLLLRGEIDTSGMLGTSGGNGSAGSLQGPDQDAYGGSGGSGADVGTGDGAGGAGGNPTEDAKAGGSGGDGGAGAGGGVVLACSQENGMFITGSITATGGGDSLTNGGTVKILFPGDQITLTGDIQAGRVYQGALWVEPTHTPTVPATPTSPPTPTSVPTNTPTPEVTPTPTPLRSDLNRDGVIDINDLFLFQQDWHKQRQVAQ